LLAAISVIVIELVSGAAEGIEVSAADDVDVEVLLSVVQAAPISVSDAATAMVAHSFLFFISFPPRGCLMFVEA
jgi:hypothetical protein